VPRDRVFLIVQGKTMEYAIASHDGLGRTSALVREKPVAKYAAHLSKMKSRHG